MLHDFFLQGVDITKVDEKEIIRQLKGAAMATQDPRWPMDGAYLLKVIFHFKRPPEHLFTEGSMKGLVNDDAPIFMQSKPDVGNLLEIVRKALEGTVFKGWEQVNKVEANKYYSVTNGIRVKCKMIERKVLTSDKKVT